MPSERVTVVDTVGAGDTFDAGILASLKMNNLLTKPQVASLDEKALRDALALGAKAAAVTVSRAGANPPGRVRSGFKRSSIPPQAGGKQFLRIRRGLVPRLILRNCKGGGRQGRDQLPADQRKKWTPALAISMA